MKKLTLLGGVLALLLCLCSCAGSPPPLTSVPDPRARELTDQGWGYFADLLDPGGVIVGQEYHASPQEVDLSAQYQGRDIALTVTLQAPERLPYSQTEALHIGRFWIADKDGKVLTELGSCEPGPVVHGQAELLLKLQEPVPLQTENCILKVRSLVSEKKGDQPLEILGNWSIALMVPQ